MAAKTHQNDTKYHQISPTKPKTTKPKSNILSFCSLFVITVIPLCLNIAIIYLFGSSKKYQAIVKPLWFPSLTLIHIASVGSTLLMGVAAWLVWVDGGLLVDSDALPLYISQVSLSIVWDPLVLRIGEAWLGVIFCLVNLGTLFACYCTFRDVSPSCKYLVMPCLAWLGYLTLCTSMLL
ncbi:hypothetical protein MANES_03G195100v8 [Manihot esculenta]|uniref:Translocator protein homolog n=1 Tax=Manihot esculenta TaxID=3983 RepID=A0A2C9W947_MANES|nr:hypothetical protein MANES_03G195100v8 [Manihot esculenta]